MPFTIFAVAVKWDGDVESITVPGRNFATRKDAVEYIGGLVSRSKPEAGYNVENAYWWTRKAGVVTRYTIQVQSSPTEG
jgi:hypothetical protein